MKAKMVLVFLAWACLLALHPPEIAAFPESASTAAWKQIGPQGGRITGLARRPGNPNEMLAVVGSSSGFVYKTTNAGQTWQRIASLNQQLGDVAYHPTNPNIIYVLPRWGDRILKSTNGGTNWTQHPFGARLYVTANMVIDPANPSTLYVGGQDSSGAGQQPAVFKSTDGGASWSSLRIGPQHSWAFIRALALAHSDPRILYVSAYSHTGTQRIERVYKSTDRGATWQNITGAIGEAVSVSALTVDPQSASRVYAGSSWGIYRSTNGGATWTKNSGTAYATSLAIDPANANVIYAGYNDRFFKSTDGGITWSGTTAGLAGLCEKIFASPAGLYFGSSAGLYMSRDGGTSWAARNQGIFAVDVGSIALARSSPNLLYAEGQGNGFFRSTNFGATWQRLPDFYRCDAIRRIFVNPNNGQDLYILAGG